MGRPRKYRREEIDAALDRHIPGQWEHAGPTSYRIIVTDDGDGRPLILSLREAYIFVQGLDSEAVAP